jgi:predicted GIY-YIG superfamily endonuclease
MNVLGASGDFAATRRMTLLRGPVSAQVTVKFALLQMNKTFCVYIAANRRNGALYVDVTSDLARRIWQHKQQEVSGFSAKYGVDKLVYFETCESAEAGVRDLTIIPAPAGIPYIRDIFPRPI